jgi:hypothetical protein
MHDGGPKLVGGGFFCFPPIVELHHALPWLKFDLALLSVQAGKIHDEIYLRREEGDFEALFCFWYAQEA